MADDAEKPDRSEAFRSETYKGDSGSIITITQPPDRTAGKIYADIYRVAQPLLLDSAPGIAKWWYGINTLQDAQNKGWAPTNNQMKIIEPKIISKVNALYDDPNFISLQSKDALRKVSGTLSDTIIDCIAVNKWNDKWCDKEQIKTILDVFSGKNLQPEQLDTLVQMHESIKREHISAREKEEEKETQKKAADMNMPLVPPKTPSVPKKSGAHQVISGMSM